MNPYDETLMLCMSKGTDDEFREFVQRQPSCISRQFSEYNINDTGEDRCVAAHVRRAGMSGTGYKAEYSCVPLTQTEHDLQHGQGETELMSKDEWNELVIHYRKLWLRS